MNIPEDLHYTKDHEWIRVDGDAGTIGITDFAQGELGDIVYFELPEVGDPIVQGEAFGTVEAVKAAAELFAPLSGEVTAVNGLLDQSPEMVNQSPYEAGWIIKVRVDDPELIDTMLTPDQYRELVETRRGD